jgi:ribosome biogenesis protein YTM1
VSSVRWSPTDPFVLASTSHDGTLKVWDIRSYLPLHTVNAVNNKKSGEKALCLAFGDGIIYSGGSDCVVKQFSCNI